MLPRAITERAGAVRGSALLPAQHGPGVVRELRAWRREDRSRIAGVVAERWARWRAAWGLAGGRGAGAVAEDVSCESLFEATASRRAPPSAWQPVGAAASGMWWAPLQAVLGHAAPRPRGPAAGPALVFRLLFGEPPVFEARVTAGEELEADGSIANEVTASAWADLWARLAVPAEAEPRSVDAPLGAPEARLAGAWSGALALTVRWEGDGLMLLLSAETVARIIGAPRAPAPRDRHDPAGSLVPIGLALARQTARIHAATESFELDLGSLVSLQVGDVVRTPHRLEAAFGIELEVEGGSRQRICEGFLGRAGAWRAMQLTPQSSNPTPTSTREHR